MQGFGDCLFNPFIARRHTPQYCLRLKELQELVRNGPYRIDARIWRLPNSFTAGRHTPQYCLRLKELQELVRNDLDIYIYILYRTDARIWRLPVQSLYCWKTHTSVLPQTEGVPGYFAYQWGHWHCKLWSSSRVNPFSPTPCRIWVVCMLSLPVPM